MIGYILITCMPSQETDVIAELNKIPEVHEVNGIMGKYDIFVKVIGKIPDECDLIVSKIRSIKGITASYTMTALYDQGGTIDTEKFNQ